MGKQESKKSVAKALPLTDEELATRVREALAGKGLTAKQLAKLVGKAAEERALGFARDRAAAGEFFREPLDNDEWFFAEEPFATLDRVVPALLRSEGPLPAQALKKKPFAGALEQAAPGHSGLIEMWHEDALKRGLLFEVPQRGGKRPTTLLSADPIEPISNERIISTVRELLQGKGVKAAELLKQVGKVFDGEGARAVELARDRAASGELFRVSKGNNEWFFAADPIATLDRTVVELLRENGPLPAKQLTPLVERSALGHSWLLPEWQKGALARGLVFEVSLAGPPKTKVLSAELDLKVPLGKALVELQKALTGLERQGVTRERVLEFLRVELKVEAKATPPLSPALPKRPSREVFLEALRRFADDNPKGALLPERELRARAGLGKQDFDSAALDLSQEGLLVLHHHDHAATLSEAEQSALVRDGRGQHYVGIALRGSA